MADVQRGRGAPGRAQAQPILAPNWFLGLVPRQYWDRYKSFYVYELDFALTPLANGGAVPANGTSTGAVQIQKDSHFLCVAGVALVTTTDNLTVVNSFSNANTSRKLVNITDAGAGNPVSNVVVPLESMFGTGTLPAVWPMPKLFEAAGAIAVTVQDLGGTAHTVRLSFWGIRIYPAKRMDDAYPSTA